MANKGEKLWVVIADGEHARVVMPAAANQFKTTLALDSAAAHKRSLDLGSDRPGRQQESASTTRHAITPKHDPHELAKHDFLREVARQLDEHAAQRDFDRLVLVAPDRALNDLRAALGNDARARLAGALDKDLVNIPDHALYSHLESWWQAPEIA
jgi:protein required for attachment to host cells